MCLKPQLGRVQLRPGSGRGVLSRGCCRPHSKLARAEGTRVQLRFQFSQSVSLCALRRMGFVLAPSVAGTNACRSEKCARIVRCATPVGGEGDWSVAGVDPSRWEGPLYSGLKKARGCFHKMPLVEKSCGGVGSWEGVDWDLSHVESDVDTWSRVEFDESHVDGNVLVECDIDAPRQAQRPERQGMGVWASADVDPSRMFASPSGWSMVDLDPSFFGYIGSERKSFKLHSPQRAYAHRGWMEVDIDASSVGRFIDSWTTCDLDPSSVGFVARDFAPRLSHARTSVSMTAADGTLIDIDPSCMEIPSKAEDEVWTAVDWDDTHELIGLTNSSESKVVVPSELLWLMDETDRVVLETVAGGNFVIIARSGGRVAAAFAREGTDLMKCRADLPQDMELFAVPQDMYEFLHSLAERQLEAAAAKWDGAELIMAGAGI